ncbi:MAG: hypothetical protein RMM06_06575 [Armatimonadota bacterium]|nr:hypothetical protein [Armatimonadota bacterium]
MRKRIYLLSLAPIVWATAVFWILPRLLPSKAQPFAGYLLLLVSLILSALLVRLLRQEIDAWGMPTGIVFSRMVSYFCLPSVALAYPWLGLGDMREFVWTLTLFFPIALGVFIEWLVRGETERPFGLVSPLTVRFIAIGLVVLLVVKWQQLRLDTALLLLVAIGASLLGSRDVAPRPDVEGAPGVA